MSTRKMMKKIVAVAGPALLSLAGSTTMIVSLSSLSTPQVGVLGAHLNKRKGKAKATASSARAINANRVERLLQDSLQLDDEVREIAKGVDDVVDITEEAEQDTRLYSVPVVVDIEDEEQKSAVTALKDDVLALKGMVAALVQVPQQKGLLKLKAAEALLAKSKSTVATIKAEMTQKQAESKKAALVQKTPKKQHPRRSGPGGASRPSTSAPPVDVPRRRSLSKKATDSQEAEKTIGSQEAEKTTGTHEASKSKDREPQEKAAAPAAVVVPLRRRLRTKTTNPSWVSIQYALESRTPPVPALLAEVLADNVGAGRANFAEDAAVAARDLYSFSQCNNSCYMAAAFSSLLRTPAARKYLDETFCPALSGSKLGAQQQRDLDMFGGWQYGFPRAFCTLWAAFKTENKGASDKAYRAWKNLFFAKRLRPPGFRRGKQADMDEALPKTLYMLAVPKRLPEAVPRGKETAALPGRQTEFHADFGGSAFMNDFGTVKLAVLRGHGEEGSSETFPAAGRQSWRGSRCIRQMAGLGRENGLRYVPKLDALGNLLNRGVVTAQDILDESFLEVESENDTVLRAWREEPVLGSPEECRVDNGRGQVHVVQLTHLPKSGLLPIFVQRTLLGQRIDVAVDLPLTVKVKQEYFAEAISPDHKPSKDKPWQYSLRSFACQAGDLDKGHWYAYAKVGKNWFELNSSNGVHAKKVSGDIRKVLKREQKNVVQIFYERTA